MPGPDSITMRALTSAPFEKQVICQKIRVVQLHTGALLVPQTRNLVAPSAPFLPGAITALPKLYAPPRLPDLFLCSYGRASLRYLAASSGRTGLM